MSKAIVLSLLALSLAACGVDGAPVKPTTTVKQTFGINSETGSFTKTTVGIEFEG